MEGQFITNKGRFGLGFDVRETPCLTAEEYDPRDREMFLILPTVAVPLSIMWQVWGSVFYTGGSGDENDSNRDVNIENPTDRFAKLEYWEDPLLMYEFTRSKPILSRSHWPIYVELVDSDAALCTWPQLEQCGPLTFDVTSWMPLGYDVFFIGVGDSSPFSLVSSGFPVRDGTRGVDWIANGLNGNHLFNKLEDASRYRDRFGGPQVNFIAALYRINHCIPD